MPERAKRPHRASIEPLGSLDLDRVEREIARTLRDILAADAAAVMLADSKDAFLVIDAQDGLSDEYARAQRIPFDAARGSFKGTDDHVILDLRTEGFGDKALVRAEGLARVLAIPLTRDGEFIGSLNAYLKDPNIEFNAQSIDRAHALAVEASVAIGNARIYREVVRQSELQAAIFNAVGEGIVIVYPPGRIAALNDVAADFLGVDPDGEALALSAAMARLSPPDALAGEASMADQTPAMRALRGEDVRMELVLKNVNTGVERIVDLKARPVRAEGEVVAAVVTIYDLTELRHVEEEKEQFLSIVSHELRTPLTPLKAVAQLLIARIRRSRETQQPLDMDSLERNLASIERQVDRMNGLVTDLLSVSRAGRGKLELDARMFDLATSVRDMVDRYVVATREEGRHSFVVEAPERLLVTADQARVEQMLMNLIGNAVKYSPRGGEVRVQLQQQNGEAEILIQDQGIGIGEEDLRRLGEPFTRGTGKAASFAGMGIGLHVARLMAEGHGGSLTLESEGEDRGATVRVKLPA